MHKCSMDCISKGLQPVNDLQGHSRSLPLVPFDRPYTIRCYSVQAQYVCTLHCCGHMNSYLPTT